MLLARADSGKERLDTVVIDANSIVRGAAEQGEKLARSQNLKFFTTFTEKSVYVRADPDAVRRALLILIDNGAKYTPKGGTIHLDLKVDDKFATMSVSDTGIGIAAEDVAHIFDRFWRADRARSREQGGAGLGLSIAKWIADMHRGSIEVESEVGKGSAFHLQVPIEEA